MSPVTIAAVIGLIGLLYPALLVVIALPRGRWAATSRAQLVAATADALLALVFLHRLLDWSLVPPPVWLLPVAVLAGGVLAALLRWPELPAWRPGRPRRGQRVVLGARLGVVALIAAALLWW